MSAPGTAIDLAFILKDTHGDIAAAQRRIDRAIRAFGDEQIGRAARACAGPDEGYLHGCNCRARVNALKSKAGL